MGLAQNDRVLHPKRGLGTVTAFYGGLACVVFDNEPHGQHKYTGDKCQRALTFADGSPIIGEEEDEPTGPAPVTSKRKGGLRKGVRIEHPTRGRGKVTGTWNGGRDITVKYDNDPEEFEYDMGAAVSKLKNLDAEDGY